MNWTRDLLVSSQTHILKLLLFFSRLEYGNWEFPNKKSENEDDFCNFIYSGKFLLPTVNKAGTGYKIKAWEV